MQRWPAHGARRGSVLLLHGLGEHAGRQLILGAWLAAAGFDVVAPDLPGHGRSPGRRGDAAGIGALVDAIRPLWDSLPTIQPRLLAGHSFGGLIATVLAAEVAPQLGALVLSSPFFAVGTPPQTWQRVAAAVLRVLAPALALPTGLDPRAVSHDPDVVQAYRADPLVHDRLSARLYASLVQTQQQLPQLAAALALVPVLSWHGDADRLTSHAATARIAPQFSAPGSRFLSVTGGFHELYHDTPETATQVRAALDAFLIQVLR